MSYPKIITYIRIALTSLAITSILGAADAPARANGPAASKTDGETIDLSPFVVNTNQDSGYLAANTLSGSRLNTPLIDTPASISEMTKDFLNDIGANNTMDAVEYALGFQADRPGSNDNLSQFNSQTVVSRGIGRSGVVARDYFDWNQSGDVFSAERLSLSRGPNSVLYGLGNAGGIINTTSKRANFRTRTELNLKTDENGSMRVHVDHNQKLTDSAAIRINLLSDDVRTWREKEYQNSKRVQLAGTWRPFARTEVRVDYERGVQARLIGLRFSGRDYFTSWLAAGSPAYDRLVNSAVYPAPLISYGVNPRLSYDGDSKQWLNLQRLAATPGIAGIAGGGLKLQDEKYLPFTALLDGPAATTDNTYWTGSIFVEQEVVKNLFVELAINKQGDTREGRRTMTHDLTGLRIDPNKTLNTGAANPNFGKFFIEGQALNNISSNAILSKRASLTYSFDTKNKWLGRHQLLGLLTDQDNKSLAQQWNEANLTPLNSAIPAYSNAVNTIWRRTYLNFQGGNRGFNQNPYLPQAPTSFTDATNGLNGTITPGFYTTNINPSTAVSWARMLAGQSNLVDDRLVITYGFRHDSTDRQNSVLTKDPVTQAVTAGTLLPVATYSGDTRTQGAVLHLTKWFALYGNRSDNFSPQTGLDINGNDIGNVKGEGHDYGVKFQWGENKFYARAGVYQSASTKQAGRDFNALTDIQSIWLALEGATGPHVAKFTGSPLSNTDTQDLVVNGYEFEVTANVLKGLSFTANYATLNAQAANLYPNTFAHVAQYRNQWQQGGATVLTQGAGGTVAGALALLDATLAQDLLQDGKEATGNYRESLNLFGRYQFDGPLLKGWSVGAGSRFRAGRVLGFDGAGQPVRAPKTFLTDANLAYRRQIWGRRLNMVIQLNIQNVLNNRDLYWATIDPITYVKNDYTLFTPRVVSLSGSFSY